MSEMFVDKADIEDLRDHLGDINPKYRAAVVKVIEAALLGIEAKKIVDDIRPLVTAIWMNLNITPTQQIYVIEALLRRIDDHGCKWIRESEVKGE